MADFALVRPSQSDAGVPLHGVTAQMPTKGIKGLSAVERRWITASGFDAKPGALCLVPANDGSIGRVLVGIDPDEPIWNYAALPAKLPAGRYRLTPAPKGERAERAVLGWALGTYRFDRYKTSDTKFANLVWPAGINRRRVEDTVSAVFLVRDLINTPASDMGPEQLAAAAKGLADQFGAHFEATVGDLLLSGGYPAIHAVGRASVHAPRLIDFTWGDADAPKVTLVGKGVCFDTGGLDLKPANFMRLMKKDMGGAAQVLGLAQLIMATGLNLRLRVLIPAVENSVAGNAMRPLDVVSTRKGLSVEIGHTDAEGRVVLADALAAASAESPELIIDMATLTGAARAALGAEIPVVFTSDDALADDVADGAAATGDPMWRLPLWKPYRRFLDSKTADISNDSSSPYGGAITAALFLAEFVGDGISWMHVDLMAWNMSSRPGRPEGGEAMGVRALFAMLEARYGT